MIVSGRLGGCSAGSTLVASIIETVIWESTSSSGLVAGEDMLLTLRGGVVAAAEGKGRTAIWKKVGNELESSVLAI